MSGKFYLLALIGLISAAVLVGWVFSAGRLPWVSGAAAFCFLIALAIPVWSEFISVAAGFDRLDQDRTVHKAKDPLIIPPKPEARQFWRSGRRNEGLPKVLMVLGAILLIVALGLDIQAALKD